MASLFCLCTIYNWFSVSIQVVTRDVIVQSKCSWRSNFLSTEKTLKFYLGRTHKKPQPKHRKNIRQAGDSFHPQSKKTTDWILGIQTHLWHQVDSGSIFVGSMLLPLKRCCGGVGSQRRHKEHAEVETNLNLIILPSSFSLSACRISDLWIPLSSHPSTSPLVSGCFCVCVCIFVLSVFLYFYPYFWWSSSSSSAVLAGFQTPGSH